LECSTLQFVPEPLFWPCYLLAKIENHVILKRFHNRAMTRHSPTTEKTHAVSAQVRRNKPRTPFFFAGTVGCSEHRMAESKTSAQKSPTESATMPTRRGAPACGRDIFAGRQGILGIRSPQQTGSTTFAFETKRENIAANCASQQISGGNNDERRIMRFVLLNGRLLPIAEPVQRGHSENRQNQSRK